MWTKCFGDCEGVSREGGARCLEPESKSATDFIFVSLRCGFDLWCLEPESNQRHKDFQSFALPTELSRHGAQGRKRAFILQARLKQVSSLFWRFLVAGS